MRRVEVGAHLSSLRCAVGRDEAAPNTANGSLPTYKNGLDLSIFFYSDRERNEGSSARKIDRLHQVAGVVEDLPSVAIHHIEEGPQGFELFVSKPFNQIVLGSVAARLS